MTIFVGRFAARFFSIFYIQVLKNVRLHPAVIAIFSPYRTRSELRKFKDVEETISRGGSGKKAKINIMMVWNCGMFFRIFQIFRSPLIFHFYSFDSLTSTTVTISNQNIFHSRVHASSTWKQKTAAASIFRTWFERFIIESMQNSKLFVQCLNSIPTLVEF